MTSQPFGTLADGTTVEKYTLRNASGASAEIITYGGIITALRVPDREGKLADVVLGFDTLAAYLAGHPYFGAIIGRIAGRVTAGKLRLPDGTRDLAALAAQKGTTLVVVSHDPAMYARMDRVVGIVDGRLVE